MPRVLAVIVTYHPDLVALERLLHAISTQVEGIVIVDNGSAEQTISWMRNCVAAAPCQILPLEDNRGIATAQNAGIQAAIEAGTDYVILFDQDSHPASNMVATLMVAAERLLAEGHKVAAVGPRYADNKQEDRSPFIKASGFKLTRQPCDCPDSVVEVDCLIASGSLIPVTALAGR